MLSQEENRRLTQVGKGTPMGEVLRRHWHPIAGIDELDKNPIKPVRIMGEDLVLFKDLSGNYGLVDRRCPHRNADLSYGVVEDNGIRCTYHGWCFDRGGECVEMPYQDQVAPNSAMKSKIHLSTYQILPKAGMLWAYMGPSPAPCLPDWEAFHWDNGFVQVVFSDIPCNWLQTQENSIDPIHFEWTHENWSRRLANSDKGYSPKHTKLAFEEFDHGLIYKRITEATDEKNPLWTIGRVCLWPNGFFLGDHFEWRVPVDDENTLSVLWSFFRVPKESEPYKQEKIPSWWAPIYDKDGRWITTHVLNQDIVAWVGQGKITDRSKENLALSDGGIVMLRRQLQKDIVAVQEGRDPKGIIRDEQTNVKIKLPSDSRDIFLNGLTRAEYDAHPKWSKSFRQFIFHTGQPREVREAYEKAAGIKMIEDGLIDL